MTPSFLRLCDDPDSGISYVEGPLEFPRPGIGSILTYMTAEGLLFFMITLMVEVSPRRRDGHLSQEEN